MPPYLMVKISGPTKLILKLTKIQLIVICPDCPYLLLEASLELKGKINLYWFSENNGSANYDL